MASRSTCSLPCCASNPPRKVRMSISSSPSRVTLRPSMRTSSACNASGGAICGSESGQRGSSNGSSLLGSASVAPETCNASSRSRRPSNGRSAKSRYTRSAVNTIGPLGAHGASSGGQSGVYAKRTPRSVSGPRAGPSTCCHVSAALAGRRATIWRSNRSRPPIVVSSQYPNTTTARVSAPASTTARTAR